MTFESSAYVLAAFLVVFGLSFFVVAALFFRRGLSERRSRKGLYGIITPAFILLLLGFLYLYVAHWSVLVGVGYAVELTNEAPCENVVNQSVYDSSTDSTTYTYFDVCEDRVIPDAIQKLYKSYTTILYIDFVLIAVGISFYLVWAVFSRW